MKAILAVPLFAIFLSAVAALALVGFAASFFQDI